ncbi:hypothetical protein [Thermomonospora cellulosilytica]|uniref:Uncharacterized protein n=1 Tax=Thermomonospora cellulosilytica TaxID=1411118 RepID=A0A7W3N1Q1_9ACTN|nr:hypothetical protein [Thermomonospora cellulosilytica]MBA9005857.1 hypothetical protein [Thermomonospora cellulosilytica]
MKPQTQALRDALAALGVTGATVRTPGGVTSAATLDPREVEIIEASADRLTGGDRYGVIITRRPDGTPFQALVTTNPRYAGRVHRKTLDVPTRKEPVRG